MTIDEDVLEYLEGERRAWIHRGQFVTELERMQRINPEAWAKANVGSINAAIDRLIASGKIEQNERRHIRRALEVDPPATTQLELF